MQAFGSNSHGQLGIGNSNDTSSPESCIFAAQSVIPKYVACGANHALVISEEDELWVTGSNSHGQIGLDVGQTDSFVRLSCDSLVKLESVAAGWNHSLVLLQNGQVYALGANNNGQCGVTDQQLMQPRLILGLPRLVEIIASLQTSFGLDFEYFSTGFNFDENTFSGIPMKVVSGWNFSGCLLDNGNIYLWGRCDMGQLAYDPQAIDEPLFKSVKNGKICDSPCLNRYLKQIKTIVCGSESCLVLDKDRTLFSFGWNEHGNCGCSHSVNIYKPIVIGKADLIAAGYGYSFIYNAC